MLQLLYLYGFSKCGFDSCAWHISMASKHHSQVKFCPKTLNNLLLIFLCSYGKYFSILRLLINNLTEVPILIKYYSEDNFSEER